MLWSRYHGCDLFEEDEPGAGDDGGDGDGDDGDDDGGDGDDDDGDGDGDGDGDDDVFCVWAGHEWYHRRLISITIRAAS
eukprot:COSAG01_NODE_1773_length_9262_cov_268.767216_7_plen_79_part_00